MRAWILADSVIFDPIDQSLTTVDGSKKMPLSIREVLLLSALLQKESDKRRLIDIVWPNTIVSDSSYHKLLFELRANIQAIGLPPDSIKTIPRRGCSINISAVEVSDATLLPPSQSKRGDGADENLNLDYKPATRNRMPLKHDGLREFIFDAIKNIFHCSSRCSGFFLKKKFLVCTSIISTILSVFIFYTALTSSFGEIAVYNVNSSIKNKNIYSLNKDGEPWGDEILSKPFLTGFSYRSGDEVVYFICKEKGFGKCGNHIFILR